MNNVAVPWLTRNGDLSPVVSDKLPSDTRDALDQILDALDGDAVALAAETRGSARVDFILNPAELSSNTTRYSTSRPLGSRRSPSTRQRRRLGLIAATT